MFLTYRKISKKVLCAFIFRAAVIDYIQKQCLLILRYMAAWWVYKFNFLKPIFGNISVSTVFIDNIDIGGW